METLFKVKGKRTYTSFARWNESTQKYEDTQNSKKELDFSVSFTLIKDNNWLHIVDGGVTGYESLEIKDLIAHKDWSKGWYCCTGTPGRWDALWIYPEEMLQLKQFFIDHY